MGLCSSSSKPEVQQDKPHILGNKRKVSWTSGSMFEVFGATGALSWRKKNQAEQCSGIFYRVHVTLDENL